MPEFEQVIAPLARPLFLAEYWNKSFLFKKGEAGRFTDLLGWDELNANFGAKSAQPAAVSLDP